MSDLVALARNCAESVHMGQRDKAGLDYVTAHVSDVVRRLGHAEPEVLAVAWLHDVVEDGQPDVLGQLREGFPPEIVAAVLAITHRKHEYRADYYQRVRANPIARRVKLADVASNSDPERLSLLDQPTRERLTHKYTQAQEALA